MQDLNLAAKIAAVSGELVAIPKIKHQGATVPYAFRSIDEVMNALNPLLEKYKLVLSISIIDRKLTQVTSGKGTAGYAAEVVINLNVTDGSETISTQEWALSVDYSDKSPTQAMSMAYKYALIRIFVVTTKDLILNDADRRDVEFADQPIKPEAKAPIKSTAERAKDFKKSIEVAQLAAEFDTLDKDTKNGWFSKWDAAPDKAATIEQLKVQINALKQILKK